VLLPHQLLGFSEGREGLIWRYQRAGNVVPGQSRCAERPVESFRTLFPTGAEIRQGAFRGAGIWEVFRGEGGADPDVLVGWKRGAWVI
jgi:hypothetical protein